MCAFLWQLSPGGTLDEETVGCGLSNLGRSADGMHQVYLNAAIPVCISCCHCDTEGGACGRVVKALDMGITIKFAGLNLNSQ